MYSLVYNSTGFIWNGANYLRQLFESEMLGNNSDAISRIIVMYCIKILFNSTNDTQEKEEKKLNQLLLWFCLT